MSGRAYVPLLERRRSGKGSLLPLAIAEREPNRIMNLQSAITPQNDGKSRHFESEAPWGELTSHSQLLMHGLRVGSGLPGHHRPSGATNGSYDSRRTPR